MNGRIVRILCVNREGYNFLKSCSQAPETHLIQQRRFLLTSIPSFDERMADVIILVLGYSKISHKISYAF